MYQNWAIYLPQFFHEWVKFLSISFEKQFFYWHDVLYGTPGSPKQLSDWENPKIWKSYDHLIINTLFNVLGNWKKGHIHLIYSKFQINSSTKHKLHNFPWKSNTLSTQISFQIEKMVTDVHLRAYYLNIYSIAHAQ